MQRHSENALYLARRLEELGLKVYYPGLPSHSQHELVGRLLNPGFGAGGMLAMDVGDAKTADRLMTRMQEDKIGYLAVSLGYFKTLFSSPASSTSSEIPPEEQAQIGLKGGILRMSVGLDHDIARTFERLRACLSEVQIPTIA